NLIAMLEKCLGKSLTVDEGSASVGPKPLPVFQGISEKEKTTGFSGLRGDALTEFCHAVKKVELPSFNGEDP
ncbi:hypothetical protein A2U01_0108386, partial [Trifolium medium]|nr:hypothetical protein [Trifolium medium]